MSKQRLASIARPIHAVAYMALAYVLFSWSWWPIVCLLIYQKFVVSLLGNQIAQHRYFSHRSFVTTPIWHRVLSVASLLTAVSPVFYASIHRHHHVHSDTERDPHGPVNGWLRSAFYWHFTDVTRYRMRIAADLLRDRTVAWCHEYVNVFVLVVALLLSAVDYNLSLAFLAGIALNDIDLTMIRSALVHTRLPGSYRTYNTVDASWNNMWLQLLHWSEGLHNNHHAFPNRYDTALLWYEFDLSGYLIKKFIAK